MNLLKTYSFGHQTRAQVVLARVPRLSERLWENFVLVRICVAVPKDCIRFVLKDCLENLEHAATISNF